MRIVGCVSQTKETVAELKVLENKEINPRGQANFAAVSAGIESGQTIFQELRRELKNKVYESYEEVEKAVEEMFKKYLAQPEAAKELTNFHWLHTTSTHRLLVLGFFSDCHPA